MKRLIVILILFTMLLLVLQGCDTTSTPTISFSEQDVTTTTVRSALQKQSGTSIELGDSITKVEVFSHLGTDAADDFIVHVYFDPGSVWDEEHAVTIAVHTSIRAMKILFENNNVGEVVMWEMIDFTDTYGATTNKTAVRLVMTKEVADRVVNWDNVDDNAWGDYNTFFNLAELQYMHPAIQANL